MQWDGLMAWMGSRSVHGRPKPIVIIPTRLALGLVQEWAVILGLG